MKREGEREKERDGDKERPRERRTQGRDQVKKRKNTEGRLGQSFWNASDSIFTLSSLSLHLPPPGHTDEHRDTEEDNNNMKHTMIPVTYHQEIE